MRGRYESAVKKPWCIVACLGLATSPAWADDESDEATVRARTQPPSVTVVGHAEMERTGGLSLADALRPQADVDLPGGGAAGFVGRLSLRGGAPEETLLVIDGMRMSSRATASTLAGADPNLVPLSLLQRVTIQRGPTSALWGANAVAGVVELTTREPTVPRSLTGSLLYGAYLSPDDEPADMDMDMDMDMDRDGVEPFEGGVNPFFGARGQVVAALRERERFFVAGLTAGYTRGWSTNTRAHLLDATVKGGRVFDGGGTAYVWLRAFDSYTGAPSWGSLLAADAFDADDRQARQGAQVMAVVRRVVETRTTLEAGASLSASRATLYNPDADSSSGTSAVESRQSTMEVQGRLAWTREGFGPLGSLTVGVDFGHESLATETFGAPSASRGAVFVRDARSFGPVTLDLAARLDGDSQYGWFVSPRVALRAGGADSVVHGELSGGRGFRPPTFAERVWPVFVYATPSGGAVGERGNPNVGVEQAWGVDGSLVAGGGARPWQVTGRGFGLFTDGLLRWAIDRDGYWTPTNIDGAWSAGGSLEGSVRVHPRVTLLGSGFWQTTRDGNGEEIVGRLRSKATARVVWFAREGLRAWAEALWFEREGTDARGEAWRGVFVNARVGWQFSSGLGVFALGENLLGTRFESARGLPTPGRVVWLGLALDVDED